MEQLVFFFPAGHEAHFRSNHYERPERVEAIISILEKNSLWKKFTHLPPQLVPEEILLNVHDISYIEKVKSACQQGVGLDPNTYTTPESWKIALESAGGAIAVAKMVWEKGAKRGFALTRPPGHHATITQAPGQYMGYCLINNVAIASEYLICKEGAERLAIIDLDLHHGNGTQDIFWKRGDVLYISTHETPLYPWQGNIQDIGSGEGEGATLNLPLPPYSGDKAFTAAVNTIILPILDRFMPQMLLISAGFDPHWKDDYGHLLVSADCYASIISKLVHWADHHCDSRIGLFLEGGYDLDAIKACALASTNALLGQTWSDSLGPSPKLESDSWEPVIEQAREFWRL